MRRVWQSDNVNQHQRSLDIIIKILENFQPFPLSKYNMIERKYFFISAGSFYWFQPLYHFSGGKK